MKKEWTIIRSRFGEEERQHHPWRARRINENLVRMYVYQCWKKEIREKLYSHLGRMAFVVSKSFGSRSGEEEFQECGKIGIVLFTVLFILLAFRGSIRKKR